MNRPLLLIDGDCGFCTTWANRLGHWLHRDRPDDVDIRPAQLVDLDAYGLTQEQTDREVILVLPDGRRFGGTQAFANWLIWRGGPVAVVGRSLTAPALRQIADLGYRIIAANRYRLPGSSAACAIPGLE